MKLTKEQKQTKTILNKLAKEECKLPEKDKNILEYSHQELKAYILEETKNMTPRKKLKFGSDLIKRIKKEKKKVKGGKI